MEEFELEAGEHVITSVRKHWFVFFLELLPFAILAWLPTLFPTLLAAFSAAAPQAQASLAMVSTANPWIRLFLGMWWLLLWLFAFNTFTQYFLNHWILTNTRIVNIRQFGFFDRQVSSFLLARVQDVTTTVDGLFATLLHYGRIHVQTAGDSSKSFIMDGVPYPTELRDMIMGEIATLHKQAPVNPTGL